MWSSKLLKMLQDRHLWYLTALFAAISILHYSSPISDRIQSLYPLLQLNYYSLVRVMLIIPVVYAGYIFSLKGGIAALLVASLIMLPRAVLIPLGWPGALLESLTVIVTGGLVNLWLHWAQKDTVQNGSTGRLINSIIDGSPVAIFAIDKNHRVIHWNKAVEALTGIKGRDIIGTDEHWRAFYSEKRPIMATLIVDGASPEEIERYYRDKCQRSPLIAGAYEAEDWFPALGENGRWLHFTASPIKGEEGHITGAIVTLQDITERKRVEENLRYYLQEITRAQEEERKRIALELHDSTAQSLIALLHQLDSLLSDKMKLSVKESRILWSLDEQIREILQEVRRFSRDLRPSILDDLGLLAALEWFISEIKKLYGIEASLETSGQEQRITQEAELLLFRIAQEALNNTVRHARASRVIVRVDFGDNKIILTVTDDGIGFELPENFQISESRLGLAGMQERVKLLGGSLEIDTGPDRGTKVTVEVPTLCVLTPP